MKRFYFDASALAKAYVEEKGSTIVEYILENTAISQWRVLMLGLAETTSIFVRKRNNNKISVESFHASLRALRDDFIDDPDVIKVAATSELVMSALPLIIEYSINSTDAVVLRSALDINSLELERGRELLLVTADKRLVSAAEAEGLRVINPETANLEEVEKLLTPLTN